MSGGHFDYKQHHIEQIADDIEYLIENNEYSKKTLKELKRGLKIMRKAYIYAQRIDWLASVDEGEETFLKRLKDELRELDDELPYPPEPPPKRIIHEDKKTSTRPQEESPYDAGNVPGFKHKD